ncbi:MAG: acyl-CoA dehydrogenase family protein [Fimbriimonadales bacterium]
MDATTQPTTASGAFLERTPAAIFSPEQFTPDDCKMGEATERFVREQVMPFVKRLEHGEPRQMREILIDSAMLGLLGIDVPTEYGGLGLPKTTSALITEKTALQPSFAVAHAVHTSVGSLPILLFGTEEQAQHYLPKLTSGEFIGAYALTEPESGSDALAARTRAERQGDHYYLTGNKIWITNAGFADLFVTFAKVDGERFTAFLVERAPGLIVEREEHKMGLHGSSTCRVVYDRVPVPVERRLGEEGQGAYVALYTLNIGRFKIAAAANGVAKEVFHLGWEYAHERKQFGKAIIDYDLVWRKLVRNSVQTFAIESALYRLAGDLDSAFSEPHPNRQEGWRRASARYAAECALIKVASTENLQQVVDDALQIHGGYGFSEEYPIAQFYRDTRVNRIYEGTNEINRLNLVERLLYMRQQGAWTPQRTGGAPACDTVPETLQTLRYLTGSTLAQFESVPDLPQSLVEPLADALIALYLLDSAFVRAQQTGLPLHHALVAHYHEQVKRQLLGWWTDLMREPAPSVPLRPMGELYQAVWEQIRT